MGWGFDDIIDLGRDLFSSGSETDLASKGLSAEQITEALKGAGVVSTWTNSLDPGGLPDMTNYTGGPYSPQMVGWPLSIGVEAVGLPGVLPEGTFFIGHATPGMIMETFRLVQGGVPLVMDYYSKAGFVARLFQRDLDGAIIYIDGYEIGVDRESGRIVREDLRLAARSPLTAEVRYGGPIEAYLPLYIDISAYGDFGPISNKDNLQVQATATFLCQEVSPLVSNAREIEEDNTPKPYAIFAPF